MPKKKAHKTRDFPKVDKPLTPDQVDKHTPVNQVDQLQNILGFGLSTVYDLALKDENTVVAGRTNPEIKAGNVDKLPTPKK